ncbi:MAG TPA: hypothetical protein VG897_12890 [Terriglobales bacterium]|nr:hypothetical protein [Terriglobales bacterium]
MSALPIGRVRIPRSPSDMRVPDYMLQCVGFVAEAVAESEADADGYDPQATGFFVNVRSAVNPAVVYIVFVTAKHVAKMLVDRSVVLLVSGLNGEISVLVDYGDVFYLHPDESVDVAVLPINIDKTRHAIRTIPIEMFLTDDRINGEHIGIGDEVYFPGLFSYSVGARFSPILRHGNIAMMAKEPIQVDTGFAEVHLIEARSIGGISGSPVFVRPTMSLRNRAEQTMHGVSRDARLLGLIHGHWDIRESDLNNPRYANARLHGVNVGIAIVVPAQKIVETIGHPDLIRSWQERDNQLRDAITSTPDTGVE